MIKLIVSDLDGTLLKKDFSISAYTLEVIAALMKKGILFLPATGRRFQDIIDIFHKRGILCDAIEINGAQVRKHTGKALFTHAISQSDVLSILDVFQSAQCSVQVFTDQSFFAYQNTIRVAQDMRDVILRNMGKRQPLEVLPLITKEEISKHNILKLETMSLHEERLYICKEALQKMKHLSITNSICGNLEVTHYRSQKGVALLEYMKEKKINKDEVLIFGDGRNDLSLFINFPNCIASRNATKEILALAKENCGACEEDGVARYLSRLLT